MCRVLNVAIFTGLLKPVNGRQNRLLALTEQLRRFNNEVLVLEDDEYRDEEDQRHARVYYYTELTLFAKRLAVLRDFNPSFVLTLTRLLKAEDISVVQISHPSGCLAAKLAASLTGRTVRIVYDAHNVEAELVQEALSGDTEIAGIANLVLVAVTSCLERTLCRHIADRILAVSRHDADSFQRRYRVPKDRIAIIPSGCRILPPPSAEERLRAKAIFRVPPGRTVAAFHGFFPYPPNREAFDTIARRIAPSILISNPDVFFLLAGTGAPSFELTNVKSVGFVRSMRQFLSAIDLAVVPVSKGSGTRLKVLEYMGAALPIVAMRKSVEGIDLSDGGHAFLSDNSIPDFLVTLRRALAERHRWNDIGAKAQHLARQSYDWNVIGGQLERLYQTMLNGAACE